MDMGWLDAATMAAWDKGKITKRTQRISATSTSTAYLHEDCLASRKRAVYDPSMVALTLVTQAKRKK
jgi:hypothetical protein